jgi:phosphoribosylamine--glycine ligase
MTSNPACLIVGSGAREHALASALKRSPSDPRLAVWGSTRNPGLLRLASDYEIGSMNDAEGAVAFARRVGCDMAVIGPEAPLEAGFADALRAAGIDVVGPNKSQARIESSKQFAREMLKEANIPGSPFFQAFSSLSGLADIFKRYKGQIVLKADGLMGGKGVFVAGDHFRSEAEALHIAEKWLKEGVRFIVEEKMVGEEFSLMTLTDGVRYLHLPVVQDHKRVFPGDQGPNTGGMGSYSMPDGSLPFLTSADIKAARGLNEAVLCRLAELSGEPYRGILYGGFMAVEEGIRIVEYNARFGDPEALNLMTLVEGDFYQFCRGLARGEMVSEQISVLPEATVCKYVVPMGYPGHVAASQVLKIPPLGPSGIELYYGSIEEKEGKLYTQGSRTLGVVARAPTLSEAEIRVEEFIKTIDGGFFHRSDIGKERVIATKIRRMQEIRAHLY